MSVKILIFSDTDIVPIISCFPTYYTLFNIWLFLLPSFKYEKESKLNLYLCCSRLVQNDTMHLFPPPASNRQAYGTDAPNPAMTDLDATEHPTLRRVGGAALEECWIDILWFGWCLILAQIVSRRRTGHKLSHFSGKQYTKICFWKHFKQEIGYSNRILFHIWSALPGLIVWLYFPESDRPHLYKVEVICNSDTVNGSSTRCGVPIMHCAARSPPLHRKWIGSVDLTYVNGFGVSVPLELNTLKTVEMTVDFRKSPAPPTSIILCDSTRIWSGSWTLHHLNIISHQKSPAEDALSAAVKEIQPAKDGDATLLHYHHRVHPHILHHHLVRWSHCQGQGQTDANHLLCREGHWLKSANPPVPACL